MANMVTIAEAAEVLKCTKANVYQQIKQRGIPTEKRTVQILRAYTTYAKVKHVDIDELKKVMQEPAESVK